MRSPHLLRPSDLAKAIGISVQTVRDYEAWGLIPCAERGPHGYRRYTPRHLHALRVARLLIAGFGWRCAQQMLQAIHTGERAQAWAILDARHAEIARDRGMITETLSVLQATAAIIPPRAARVFGPTRSQEIHIREAAQAVGVQASTLRFWEEQGLVHPAREQHSRYRLYDLEHLRILHIIALLRKARYSVEAIRVVLRQRAQGHPDQSLAAAEEQLNELAETTARCVKATAALWEYLEIGG